jgi:hypothetical protein
MTILKVVLGEGDSLKLTEPEAQDGLDGLDGSGGRICFIFYILYLARVVGSES